MCIKILRERSLSLLQKVPCMHFYTQCPQSCSRSLLTHPPAGDSWTLTGKSGSVSCGGHCSFLLGPGVHKVVFVPSKSLFPQSCVSSGSSMEGVNGNLPQEGLCHTQIYCTQSPCPCRPVPPQEILKHNSVSVSVGSLGPGVHKICLSTLRVSDGYGVCF